MMRQEYQEGDFCGVSDDICAGEEGCEPKKRVWCLRFISIGGFGFDTERIAAKLRLPRHILFPNSK
jgi:hypothetical protein